MNLTARGVEYKTLTEDDPQVLDRLITDYLRREVKRDGWVCHWYLFGPQSVSVSRGSSFSYYRFTQALVLQNTVWVGEDTPQQEPAGSDPIMSFINS